MTHLMAFGHSVAQGYWDVEGGWIQRLRKYLDKRYIEHHEDLYDDYFFEVYNEGISGEDTNELLQRLEGELEIRKRDKEDIVILQIGVNDTQIKSGEPRVTVDEFSSNLESIIDLAQKQVNNVIFLGDGYIGDIEYSPGSKAKISDKRLEEFENIKAKICRKKGVEFIDIRSEFSREEWKEYQYDGLHPNSEGHQEIFKLVKKELERQNLI